MTEIEQLKKEHVEIQRAIKFLVDSCLDEKGISKIINPKPVVLHSIRVGMTLLNYKYPKELVMAGILHDLIEDAEITKEEIAEKFGEEVGNLVWALTSDSRINDDALRTQDYHAKQQQIGKNAVIVAIADHLDNLPYLIYAKDDKERERVHLKWLKFFNEVAPLAREELIYKEYEEKIKNL